MESTDKCKGCGHEYGWHPDGFCCLYYYDYIETDCDCNRFEEITDDN